MQNAFSSIYSEHAWDTGRRSGPGSDPKLTRQYVGVLQDFMRKHNVRSVVDLGCGDWSFSRFIDWSGVDYLGVDVVPELIARLNETYGRPGIRFAQADILEDDLPKADLAISKDVLQHWPIRPIQAFLNRLHAFDYAILTNDCKVTVRNWRHLWLPEEIFSPNSEISPGDYRPIRLCEPPFGLEAKQLAVVKMHIERFPDPKRPPEDEYKEMLLWTNPRGSHGQT